LGLSSCFILLGWLRDIGHYANCPQPSNSGDTLKLSVPSGNCKIICGWTNYSCKVTSWKIRYTGLRSKLEVFINNIIRETVIGNRGSKSVVLEPISTVVKEQRVNGGWHNRPVCLIYTLKGFERNYPIWILSKQINRQTRLYTTKAVKVSEKLNIVMDPRFVTGFTDGEGCFHIRIRKNQKCKLGWSLGLLFEISLNQKDKALLEQIQFYFGVGSIVKLGSRAFIFRVESVKDLKVIINHFEKYPLITQKRADYELFKQAFMKIKAGMNKGR